MVRRKKYLKLKIREYTIEKGDKTKKSPWLVSKLSIPPNQKKGFQSVKSVHSTKKEAIEWVRKRRKK